MNGKAGTLEPAVPGGNVRQSCAAFGAVSAEACQHRWGDAVPASRTQGTAKDAEPAATGGTSVCSSSYPRASRRLPLRAPVVPVVAVVPGSRTRTKTKINPPVILSLSTKRRNKVLRRSVKRQGVETMCGDKVWGQGVETRCGDKVQARSTHSKPSLKRTLNRHASSTRLILRFRQSVCQS
mgnify:FL=1